jgi:Gpi18-like mannosyltransferase
MKILKKSLLTVLSLRIYLHLLSLVSIRFLSFKPGFPYWESVLAKLGPRWLWLWGSFDGAHYLAIAKLGYQNTLTQAFFPVYPLLIKLTNYLTTNPLVSGLLISHLFLIGFIYFFLKLGELDFKLSSLWQSLVLLLLFPTSFYLFSVYTESLFLFLIAAVFYFSRKQKFILASIFTAIATATKFIGIFLVPALLWEYYLVSKKNHKKFLTLLPLGLLSSSGFITYLYFLKTKFNDALLFIHSQPGFGAGRQVTKLTMFYQVVFRYLKMFFLVDPRSSIYPVLWLELIISLIFLSLIIYAWIKKLRASYLIFIIPAFLLPTLTGTFSSMPRYVLACFPLFYLVSNLKSSKYKLLIFLILFLLQAWAFTRFVSGQWIA